jgi:hypothetical protein
VSSNYILCGRMSQDRCSQDTNPSCLLASIAQLWAHHGLPV